MAQAVKQLSLDNNLQSYIHNQPPAATESNRPIPFDFVAVSEDEINLIIMSMPANKSAGPDKINMCIIRDSLPYILTPLTNIINSSLSSNIYPEAQKLAEVIPILKEGDHEQAPNNQPISLLQISKICEKAMLNQFSSYLHQHNILSPHQSGNKSNHSTEMLNVYIMDNILKSMDEKKVLPWS